MNLNELIEPFELLNQEQNQKAALKPPKKKRKAPTPAVETEQGNLKGNKGKGKAEKVKKDGSASRQGVGGGCPKGAKFEWTPNKSHRKIVLPEDCDARSNRKSVKGAKLMAAGDGSSSSSDADLLAPLHVEIQKARDDVRKAKAAHNSIMTLSLQHHNDWQNRFAKLENNLKAAVTFVNSLRESNDNDYGAELNLVEPAIIPQWLGKFKAKQEEELRKSLEGAIDLDFC